MSTLALGPSFAFSLNVDDHQAIASNVERLIETLDYLGQPIEPGDKTLIVAAISTPDKLAGLRTVRSVLKKYVLARITINPESRVSALPGGAPPILVEAGWRAFCIEVANESSVRSRLGVTSPQAKAISEYSPGSQMTATGITPKGAAYPLQTVTPLDREQRWLGLQEYDQAPMSERLDGLSLEYVLLLLYSRDRGKRAAELRFDAGPTTVDLGFRSTLPLVFSCLPAAVLTLRIMDDDGSPATASLTITDEVGRVYPAQAKREAPDLGFQRQIYRSDGQSVLLPKGNFTIEYARGPEYVVKQLHCAVTDALAQTASLRLERWVNPAGLGWYSGDHHIHAAGCAHYTTPSEGIRPEDVIPQVRGEGLSVGDVLTWGPSWYHQKQFFKKSVDPVSARGSILKYDVEISGFPSSHCGHLCLLNLQQQDFPDTTTIEQWPSWNLPILQWAKEQGATVGYAHVGHGLSVDSQDLPNYLIPPFDDNGANEYLIDVAHGAVDFLSVVDTPAMAELNLWYHAMNCGFRTKIAGETDFPCLFERVGAGRTYVHLDERPHSESGYLAWIRGLSDGYSYVSEGKSHLMDFTVDDASLAGSTNEVHYREAQDVTVTVRVAALCSGIPGKALNRRLGEHFYWDMELVRRVEPDQVPLEFIVNGAAVKTIAVQADGRVREFKTTIRIERSSWIAIRIYPSSHTNPIYVVIGGEPIRASKRSAQWCLGCIDGAWSKMLRRIEPSQLAEAQEACDFTRSVFGKILREM
jgi:hypothetical protein